MKKIRFFLISLILLVILTIPQVASAQDLRFVIPAAEVEVYLEENGTATFWFYYEFQNNPNGAPIDFIDIGMPSSDYSLNSIEAEVNGNAITTIESSPFVDNGFALGLDDSTIQPGQSGTVTVWVTGVSSVLTPFEEGDRENYVDFQFSPNFFGSEFDRSTNTEYRVTIILPPGVGDEEGIYYNPVNWPGSDEPSEIGRTTADNRVYYSWFTNNADVHTQYNFGAAFPENYIPEDAVVEEPPVTPPSGGPGGGSSFISAIFNLIAGNFCCAGFGLIFMLIFGFSIYQGTVGAKKRKLQYLPPKMKIEGNGIKRGLTAVEAAILMEQPMDKVMTMILFGTLKKEAAMVVKEDPLTLEVTEPLPEGLHPYESDFLEAFKLPASKRKAALQKMMIDLVKSVSEKIKGFSRKETVAYYQDIMKRAWKMVEEANTPEVKSENYNQTMEWTMLDEDYEDRTRRTFTGGPVFVPVWWPRYSPSYRRGIGGGSGQPIPTSARPTGGVGSGGGKVSLPNIPGSDFAASVINGTTGLAAGVIGSVTSFTDGITNKTNPVPISRSSGGKSGGGGFRGGGGGSSCACACACAGCACACAGGGR